MFIPSGKRPDVLVQVEEVVRIELGLEFTQSLIIGTIGRRRRIPEFIVV